MIFTLFGPKKPLIPLKFGDLIEIQFPQEAELFPDKPHPMTGEAYTPVVKKVRVLYAKVAKVSQKRNIFIQFISKDRGKDLQVGMEGKIFSLKQDTLIDFTTKFLHRDGDILIFSPPFSVNKEKVPSNVKGIVFTTSLPIEYRAASSPYFQKGILLEFSQKELTIAVNLPIPVGTVLKLEFVIPYRLDDLVMMKGEARSCEPLEGHPYKQRAKLSLEEISPPYKDEMMNFMRLSQQPWKKN